MEETWAGMLTTHSRRDTAGSTANRVRTLYIHEQVHYILLSASRRTVKYVLLIWMWNCCVSLGKSIIIVLYYMHWSTVYMHLTCCHVWNNKTLYILYVQFNQGTQLLVCILNLITWVYCKINSARVRLGEPLCLFDIPLEQACCGPNH